MSSVPPNTPVYPPGTPVMQPVAAGQPVMVAPPQQVVVQPTPQETRAQAREEMRQEQKREEVLIFSHSNFFYWWPVWVVGYIMALITRFGPDAKQVLLGGQQEWFYPSKNLGVIFTLTFFVVILITNVTVRGLSSVVVILAAVLGVVVVLYMGWWEQLATWFNLVSIHMNMGFYVCFSTMIFLVWALSTFVYDRMSYWRVTPGQMTHEFLIGGAAKSYDTRGMVFEKRRNDLFRHWILGIGSGDINMTTTGAKKENIYISNVLFVDSKLGRVQKMIAMRVDQFDAPAV